MGEKEEGRLVPKWPQIKAEFEKNEILSRLHEGSWFWKRHVQKKCLQILGKPKFHKPGNKNSSDLRLEFRLIPSGLFASIIKYVI